LFTTPLVLVIKVVEILMILGAIIDIILRIVYVLLAPFPQVALLPFGLDDILTAGMGYFNFIQALVPPIHIIWLGFLWVMGWKMSLLVMRFIPVVRNLVR